MTLLSGKSCATALFYTFGEFTHRLLSDLDTLAACQRSFRLVEGCKEFGPLALPLFPQPESFLHRILGTLEPSGFDGLPHESFLIGRQMYFHG